MENLMTRNDIEGLAIKYLEKDNRHSSNLKHYVLRFFCLQITQLKEKEKTLFKNG
tara:strand:- start:222 stop:386 length:165 start_codon:yes stop_codon:yes gene_type:complete